ncbi:MAG: diguanylate cyclase/phosphodiesterase with sensor [Herbinix sp.]|jgi:diguanylate cyclase (GGDEF)-like protein|nr:diguanylate cyclase/phosphodiesterase with sensor [Herbinix sp.]
MDDLNKLQIDELLQAGPGGVVKLAMDEMLTIIYASDTFFSIVKNVSDKAIEGTQQLLRLVYSADVIYVTQQIASQKNRKDNMLSFQFRCLQQNGSFKWIMITGNRMKGIHSVGMKSVPVYACMAMDVTDTMVQYKKLEQSLEYNRAITELSKDLYFEYEIATDTLSFSEIFREVFGKESILTGFRKRLEKTKIIHPEELPAVVGIYNSMMSGRKQVRFELRMLPKDGKPCWYICYASIIFGENRNPYKVVGKLSPINCVENAPAEAAYQPIIDSLTNVCTKESTEIMISEALGKQSHDSLSAILLVDIRNYKNINEIRRSIHGENILTAIGHKLKKQFRTSDIIGRIGVSEFAIFLKDIQTDHLVYDIADRICNELESLYSYEHTKNGITVSIGIAFQRGGQELQTILTNANTALVMAKKVPGSSFEVFSGAVSN